MVEVRFFGKLKRFGEDPRPDRLSKRRVAPSDATTVQAVIDYLQIPVTEIAHVFLNGQLLMTCATMARWLDYPDAAERIPQGETPWAAPLHPGDRVSFFGQDMALLVV